MENSYDASLSGQDLLTDFEVNLQLANAGKRFANYLIDLVVFYLVAVLFFALYYVMVTPREYAASTSSISSITDRIVSMLVYGILSGIVEGLFKGKSLGKLITGTRAVNTDGANISFKTAMLRGLSRIVPFEPFSALGSPSNPWHDKWTNTYVIDEKLSTRK
jgi:uncharacterized RDD family membrane protein YckC